MKKFSLLLNVALIGFVAFQSFKQKEEKFIKKMPPCTTICMDYSNSNTPNFTMDADVVKMMSANYFYGNAPVPHNTSNDAKSIWFSLNTLKTFIWQIENAVVCKNRCKNTDALGIRIYYARYPNDVTVPNLHPTTTLWQQYPDLITLRPDYPKKHTIFMVPTFDSLGVHNDFDPFHCTFKNCIASSLKVTLQNKYNDSGLIKNTYMTIFKNPNNPALRISALGADPNPAAKNHGEICPPNGNGGSNCDGAYFQ